MLLKQGSALSPYILFYFPPDSWPPSLREIWSRKAVMTLTDLVMKAIEHDLVQEQRNLWSFGVMAGRASDQGNVARRELGRWLQVKLVRSLRTVLRTGNFLQKAVGSPQKRSGAEA